MWYILILVNKMYFVHQHRPSLEEISFWLSSAFFFFTFFFSHQQWVFSITCIYIHIRKQNNILFEHSLLMTKWVLIYMHACTAGCRSYWFFTCLKNLLVYELNYNYLLAPLVFCFKTDSHSTCLAFLLPYVNQACQA